MLKNLTYPELEEWCVAAGAVRDSTHLTALPAVAAVAAHSLFMLLVRCWMEQQLVRVNE